MIVVRPLPKVGRAKIVIVHSNHFLSVSARSIATFQAAAALRTSLAAFFSKA